MNLNNGWIKGSIKCCVNTLVYYLIDCLCQEQYWSWDDRLRIEDFYSNSSPLSSLVLLFPWTMILPAAHASRKLEGWKQERNVERPTWSDLYYYIMIMIVKRVSTRKKYLSCTCPMNDKVNAKWYLSVLVTKEAS
jgi:hypothetical protein